ncbi:MAG: CHRD domain-containing protein, partial [Halobacteriales archaeon]|nr:CHRD domain-containing protein [Halobacteriales archaeon]
TTSRRRVVTAAGLGGLMLAGTGVAAARGHNRNFRTHLKGRNEVPPVDTDAQGQALFKLSKDGSELHYKINVAHIDDVTQAHIHLAPAGENGGVVAFLFGFVSGGVTVNGTLVEGTLTETDLIGALSGQTLADLADEMRSGNTYVNVHTVAIPSGEIRGQIR